jgi:hypothetical protein
MNPRDPNVQQLQLVAQALGPLRERLVFVGGCATGILITDDARPPVRATQDGDLIAEITTKAKLYELGSDLRNLGFCFHQRIVIPPSTGVFKEPLIADGHHHVDRVSLLAFPRRRIRWNEFA